MTKYMARRRGIAVGPGRAAAAAAVAGVAAIAIGAGAVLGPAAAAGTAASMPPVQQSVVAEAVSQAEAEHSAAVAAEAAAEAQRAAAAAAHRSIADLARAQVGDAYRMGASGPDIFDCSGLVMWVHQQTLGVTLPHNTHAQWNAVAQTWRAGTADPLPGDIVFFLSNGANHVGIYLGDGMMVSAENPRSGVRVAPIYSGYWANKLTGFGRV